MTGASFRERATAAIGDARLQAAIDTATGNFWLGRQGALAEIPDSDELRDRFKAIRDATLGDLARHLEVFEAKAKAAGAVVHWAETGEEACAAIVAIAKRHGARLVTKGKSMASEEIHLSPALEREGMEVLETDLGEWLIQLAKEPPFHIIAPAIHKSRFDVAALLQRETGRAQSPDDISGLVGEARRTLRHRFLEAGMGVTGGNVLVSETGSLVLVTNEGNGRLVTGAPRVHVALVGIEKVAPTWDDAAVWLSLLARSSTGQPLSVYTTVVTGPARPGDADGPEEVHIVLLDNGRSRQLGTKYEEVLQCIRCGACLNICPVYREVGGHTYGSPYSGPIGAVVSPLLMGVDEFEDLPYASSLCGACKDVCPARIDLPRMLLELRADAVERGARPLLEQKAEGFAAAVMGNETAMRVLTDALRLLQKPLVKDGALRVPAALNPAGERALPALAPRSFRAMWRKGEVSTTKAPRTPRTPRTPRKS